MIRILLLSLLSSVAWAADHEICVKINVQTTDSGLQANGISEDFWQGANGGRYYLVPGYGMRVKLFQARLRATPTRHSAVRSG
jgi:hypothetical protein